MNAPNHQLRCLDCSAKRAPSVRDLYCAQCGGLFAVEYLDSPDSVLPRLPMDDRSMATSLGEQAKMKAPGEWNEYHITARGQHIVLRINGIKCSELIDQEEGHFDLKGILGLQLRSGDPMTVQFKDIYLKTLSADE